MGYISVPGKYGRREMMKGRDEGIEPSIMHVGRKMFGGGIRREFSGKYCRDRERDRGRN